jgi:hypothetical protein
VVLNIIKGFFCIYLDDLVVFVFASINVLYYIYRFAYGEPSLHSWSEENLVMVKDLSYMLLDSVCHYFMMIIKEIDLEFSFLDVSLSGFGMSVILAS